MDFNLTEEQQDIQELSRKILEDLLTNERLKAFEASAPDAQAIISRVEQY